MAYNYYNITNFKYITSNTNSTYTYCRIMIPNFDIIYKNITLDSMLKKLLQTLKVLKNRSFKNRSKKCYNTIVLIINNINVFEVNFKYKFLKKDIYLIDELSY